MRKCCEDQIQLYDSCIPKCTEDECPNIQCTTDTNNCKCKAGYVGYMCKQSNYKIHIIIYNKQITYYKIFVEVLLAISIHVPQIFLAFIENCFK